MRGEGLWRKREKVTYEEEGGGVGKGMWMCHTCIVSLFSFSFLCVRWVFLSLFLYVLFVRTHRPKTRGAANEREKKDTRSLFVIP